jgi:hypothetical protein
MDLFQSVSAARTLKIKRDYCPVCPYDECPIVRMSVWDVAAYCVKVFQARSLLSSAARAASIDA